MIENNGNFFYETKSGVRIDPARMDVNEKLFKPFEVKSFQSLKEIFAAGKVEEDTSVIGIELPKGQLITFLTKQLAYHHVAQGEIDGEPWMVSF